MPSLEFTTMVGCPLMCTICPQDNLKSAYGKSEKYLTVDNFRTILAKTPKHVRIDFSGMAEPWANPHCTEMLAHAVAEGYNVAIYTTLYGMKDAEAVEALLRTHSSQVEMLCLHLPDQNGNMRGWRHSAEYEATLLRFLAMRTALPRFEVMTMDGTGFVHPSLAHLGIFLDRWRGHTRAGNITEDGKKPIEVRPSHHTAIMCSFTPFYDQNVVLPNGDVVLCCMDYSSRHKLGNLLRQDYYDIFASAELGVVRAENMRAEFSERSLCRTCNRGRPLLTGPANRLFWQ